MFITLIPYIVFEKDIFPYANREELQIALLFILGAVGLTLYHIVDLRLKRYRDRQESCTWKMSDAHKDLASSYSYIGILNRKIEILKEVIKISSKKIDEDSSNAHNSLCQSILNAISIFGGCKDAILGFYDTKESKVLFETGTREGFHPKINRELCFYRTSNSSTKNGAYIIIRMKEEIEGVSAYCILRRHHINPQDADIIKTLLLKATSLYLTEGCSDKKK
ncbi:MAG: hypothetical protein IPN70_05075 [Candidatus Moraniibacteriota bacterium]|nr:MAG: hypothetical protein IPN70_05075 [Candidatus Moranbacteria bacterium]